MKIQSRLQSAAAPIALCAALLAPPAFAQDDTTEPSDTVTLTTDTQLAATDADDGQVIVVTGSRIARPEFANPNPIQTVDSTKLEHSGTTNLTEVLATSPALLGSTRSIDNAGSNLPNAQSVGVNNLNLRNLGTDRTLVLVDGRRHIAGYPGTAAVDINTIPTDLVESVDVLTGGVSAVYGADGVSGVVNFIMKHDFDGVKVRGQYGISQRGDAGEYYGSIIAGKNFADGRGNVTFAYEFNKDDRFSQKQRLNYGHTGPSYVLTRNPADGTPGSASDDPNIPDRVLLTNLRWADSAMGGAFDFTGDGVPEFNGDGTPYDLGSYVPGTSYTIGGDSTPIESYYGDYTPYSRKHIGNIFAHFDVSNELQFYAEGKYVKSKAWTESQPTYDLYTLLQPDNAYLAQTFGADAIPEDGVLFSRDNFDFGQRRYEMNRELIRTVFGAKGDLSDHFRYDLSFVFGQSTQRSTNYGDRIADRYYAAIDAVDDGNGNITCRINLPGETDVFGFSYGNPIVFNGPPVTFAPGECVPLSLMGNGAPSKEALDFILANHSDYARIRQYVGTFAMSGDSGAFLNLPGGPVGYAFGAEYRKESSYSEPSAYSQAGALIDNSPGQIEAGAFDVWELFSEVNLPILKDVPFAESLSVGGAFRFSDYSTIGHTKTWSVNGEYAPIRDITFRATYSKSVRAPNISELFAPQNGTFQFITDPCGPERIAEGTQYRAANCVAGLTAAGLTPDQIADFNPADSPFSPQNSSLLGVQGGNPDLSAETAKTLTFGTVLRPSFVPGLTFSVDWYSIKLSNAVQYSSAQDIVDLCYDQPTLSNDYCALISRDSDTGFIGNYKVIPANVAAFKTAGIDMNLLYGHEISPQLGRVDLRLVGNYLDKLEFVPALGAETENEMDSAAYPAPRWSATFDLTWTKGPLSLNYGINWFAKTRRVTREQEAANPDYAPAKYIWYRQMWMHNLYVSYDVTDNVNVYGGVSNLFDRKPDDGAAGYPVSAVGRAFFMGVKAKVF
ncbi:MAG: TonB-dependent receptor [Candidatus Andeanibacterium colombiense]|uniref:TonB-dependent receptor n=1 Tax=Candidatus Andeanibacterium colombiense TaxID=3121345 RepID=A0AAJ5XC27_9SPHN|nr:MAG: TonB-dependent receptor [Sphingomonadaceae bacterium]